MPLYVRICKKCGTEFEGISSFKDREKLPCPKCNAKDSDPVFQPTPDVWKCDGSYKKS